MSFYLYEMFINKKHEQNLGRCAPCRSCGHGLRYREAAGHRPQCECPCQEPGAAQPHSRRLRACCPSVELPATELTTSGRLLGLGDSPQLTLQVSYLYEHSVCIYYSPLLTQAESLLQLSSPKQAKQLPAIHPP